MSGADAISVVALASCGDKQDNATTSPDTAPVATTDSAPAVAAPAKTETVSLELSGLK